MRETEDMSEAEGVGEDQGARAEPSAARLDEVGTARRVVAAAYGKDASEMAWDESDGPLPIDGLRAVIEVAVGGYVAAFFESERDALAELLPAVVDITRRGIELRAGARIAELEAALRRIVSVSECMSADYISGRGEGGHAYTARIARAALGEKKDG